MGSARARARLRIEANRTRRRAVFREKKRRLRESPRDCLAFDERPGGRCRAVGGNMAFEIPILGRLALDVVPGQRAAPVETARVSGSGGTVAAYQRQFPSPTSFASSGMTASNPRSL